MYVEKNVLLSIKQVYAEQILCGVKKWELRKSSPHFFNRLNVFMYATAPVGQVIGMFSCVAIVRMDKDEFWYKYGHQCGISDVDFTNYYANCTCVTAWKVEQVVEFNTAFGLEILGMRRPPLSWCYF